MPDVGILFTALALGVATSLHCACMCGGLSYGLMVAAPAAKSERITTMALIQGGRITSYAALGFLVSSLAGFVVSPQPSPIAINLIQLLSASVLMFAGLSVAGLGPAFAVPAAVTRQMSRTANALSKPLRRSPKSAPLAMGLCWGMTPCPLVYAALFSAALTGTPLGGLLFMMAFGLGTLPGSLGAAAGMSALSGMRLRRSAQIVMGLAIVGIGAATLAVDLPLIGALCVSAN